jgi:predicted TIM-barrel fold metal-dependent hydrolase
MDRIDAHIHYNGDHADNLALLEKHGLKLLNISVPTPNPRWRRAKDIYPGLTKAHSGRYSWVGGFNTPSEEDFADPTAYAQRAIADIDSDVADMAVACKIWKNLGMEVKKPDGSFVMPDDEIFDPMYEHLVKIKLPLLAHIAEPLACWQPLVDNKPHYGYYKNNQQWHMYGKTEYPSHERLIEARDNIMAKHPDLVFVGAHLGSLEYDVREVAKRMDRFPNFVVDTSARTADLTYQDVAVVKEFFNTYQDRILFGTDIVRMDTASELAADERAAQVEQSNQQWEMEFNYYESSGEVTFRSRKTEGLGLSGSQLEKFYTGNARRWYPGL